MSYNYEQAVAAARGLARKIKRAAFVVTLATGYGIDDREPPQGAVWFRVHQDGRISQ